MILSDSHVHSTFSSDGSSTMEEHIRRGKELKLSSLCFTDHIDYGFPSEKYQMNFLFDIEEYFAAFQAMKQDFPDFPLRIGVELGLKEDILADALALTSSYPFDFVIGSTHLVDNMDPYYEEYWETHGEAGGIRRYFTITYHNLSCGFDYDVYGHLDYVIRYCPTMKKARFHGQANDNFFREALQDNKELIDEILLSLIKENKGLECNTAGFKYGLGHTNPHEIILSRYHELGGQYLTIGSDAHEAAHLAYDFAMVPDILRGCGFDSYTEYWERKAVEMKL